MHDGCVAIDEFVVDVSRVLEWHPGGRRILESCYGRDVTDLFHALHTNVSYDRFVVGRRERDEPRPAHVDDFRRLRRRLVDEGWYVTSATDVAMAFASSVACLVVFLCLLATHRLVCGAIALGVFWHQVAGVGHDLGHSALAPSRRDNLLLGSCLAAVTGISTLWWRESHFAHHAHTNVFEDDPDVVHAPLLALSTRLFRPFYHRHLRRRVAATGVWRRLVRAQHLTLYPLLLFARFNLYAQSVARLTTARGPHARLERIGLLFFALSHLALCVHVGLVSFLCFVLLSHLCAGVLHIQIVISHWDSDLRSALDPPVDHFLHTLLTTSDVACVPALDVLHLGLQFQVAHHMFPRLPRRRLRAATELVRQVCARHGLPYRSDTFVALNRSLLGRLARVAQGLTDSAAL